MVADDLADMKTRRDSDTLPVPAPMRMLVNDGKPPERLDRLDLDIEVHRPHQEDAVEFDIDKPEPVFEFVEIKIDDEPIYVTESDNPLMARFFAICVAMLGLAMIVPAALTSAQSFAGSEMTPMSRWQIVSLFLGGLHLAYAVYLFQIPDLAALWSVAVFLLAAACVQAVIAMGLWLDSGSGPIRRWLQIPNALASSSTLWSFLYLCFAAILCSMCGYHAYQWQIADRVRSTV